MKRPAVFIVAVLVVILGFFGYTWYIQLRGLTQNLLVLK